MSAHLGSAIAVLLVSCSSGTTYLATGRSAIVYGPDDRKELYQVEDPRVRSRIEGSVAAIIPKALISGAQPFSTSAPSYADLAGLCPDERFADEPAAALCTAVLVDWDLVLTAGHCVHAIRRDELAVVFGFYYDEPGKFSVGDEDVFDLADVVAEAAEPPGAEPRLDFAWIRLSRAVGPNRQPVPIRHGDSTAAGDPILFAGMSGGVPAKLDDGARIYDPRPQWRDFFLANTDTTRGASGGAALDSQLALLGVLARGGPDLVQTEDGCNASVLVSGDETPQEEFTYADRALQGLCDGAKDKSSLCRDDCGDPCGAEPRSNALATGGCNIGPQISDTTRDALPLVAVMVAAYVFRRGGRQPR